MKINIFGSTGTIGIKSLDILYKYFPSIKINLLVSNKNISLLSKQVDKFKPKYIYINDQSKYMLLRKLINNSKTKILNYNEFVSYMNESYSDLTLLCVSGYDSLNYIECILKNTKKLGLVSKECIVSAGHIFKKIISKRKTIIYPLDSEHFSLFNFFNKLQFKNNYKKIYLTASGGPFLNTELTRFKDISFAQAIIHPKWKMGYKNSIDSATMANKCLEIIEAHYLFNIPYNKIDIVVHPESLIHSIVEYNDFNSHLNYFFNDMFIPIFNFINDSKKSKNKFLKFEKFNFKKTNLNFLDVDYKRFPIFKTFMSLDKSNVSNIIKFNCANEHAVNLFKHKKIKFVEFNKIINKCLEIDINLPFNSVKNIIKYNKLFLKKINETHI
jgi:1-deoxy-D-xylulose-5-phosphate reductoisomerase